MRRTLEEWKDELDTLCVGTEYAAIRNGGHGSNSGIAIVPKGYETPQRLCVYPRKEKGAALAIEKDVCERVKHIIGEGITRKNRPHYNGLSDESVVLVCKTFLGKQ